MPSERVLIVEDESVVQLHLKRVLGRLGYGVAGVASSRRAAVEIAAAERPDLVLMDIRLEDGDDGVETAGEIRSQHEVPVVFLTAYADQATLDRVQAIEPAGYIVKPFTDEDLQATLSTALNKHKAVRRIQAHGEWLTTILESIGDGVIVTDAEARVTFMNSAAERLTGRSLGLAEERDVRRVCTLTQAEEEAPPPVDSLIEDALDEGRRSSVREARLDAADGQERTVDLSATPLLQSDGSRDGLVLILRDVSERQEAVERVADLQRILSEDAQFHGMVGRSRSMERVYQQVREVAAVDWTVLIEGETGTGKELVARAIHAESPRASGPFVPVNTAGLTGSLLASQLFGHRKGAFTDATADQTGLFEAADGGTLFLDEIGDVPPEVQSSLLRVLEDRAVTPLGSTEPRQIDVRFLAATHCDLPHEVEAKRFRADLLYRLRVARIDLPPLRQRTEDIEPLAAWFLDRARAASGKPIHGISDEAWRLLRDYDWPGNVREIRSAIEYAVIRCRGNIIEIIDLPPELTADLDVDPRAAILQALAESDGNRTLAAQLLGVSRATLYRRLAEHGIDLEEPSI